MIYIRIFISDIINRNLNAEFMKVFGVELGNVPLILQSKASMLEILGEENIGKNYVYVKGLNHVEIVLEIMKIQVWNSICLIFDNGNLEIENIYLNGKVQNLPSTIKFGYSDEANITMFNNINEHENYFIGSITDLNIWNKTLTVDEAKKFHDCTFLDSENSKLIYNWKDSDYEVINALEEMEADKEDVCPENEENLYFVSVKERDFKDSLVFCSETVGGKLAAMENEEEKNKMKEVVREGFKKILMKFTLENTVIIFFWKPSHMLLGKI